MEKTYRRRVPPQQVISWELARHLVSISSDIGRQVGVLLARDGTVRSVIVGDRSHLVIPEVGRLRGGQGRFRGLRLVHTHLKGEPLSQDDLNDLALLRLDLMVMVEVRAGGLPGRIELAHVVPVGNGDSRRSEAPFRRISASSIPSLEFDFGANIRALEEEFRRVINRGSGPKHGERGLLIGLRGDKEHFEEMLDLVEAADVVLAGSIRHHRKRIHPKTVVGHGKIQEIVLEAMRSQVTVALFDIDLKPAQARAFEDATGLKTIDRTQLILDIFAQRARSRDGRLQVELAQLKYSLPRLTEKDSGLSRLTGGIGGRGPGETILEIGRRRIQDRIRSLEKQVDQLSRQRDLRRRRRRKQDLPILSIIGYTNAGKSTLLNVLTNSQVVVADKLFVTLDPTSRRLRFPRSGEVIITDTVGFISELPEDLLAAFRATLEELVDADILLHVVDASDPCLEHKLRAVELVLSRLDLSNIPCLLVLNKVDLLDELPVKALARRYQAIPVSAASRRGLEELVSMAESLLRTKTVSR